MSRRDRRLMLKQSMAAVSRRGIDLRAAQSDQSWSVVAATRIMYDMLRGHSPARASSAAKWAHDFFEVSLKHNPSRHQIECAKGCAFCCHVSVTALAPEIFLVASHIRQEYKNEADSILERVRAADRNTRGLSSFERATRRLPCGLLRDNCCTVYSARPSACRGLTSTSVRICERGFNGEDVQVLTPEVWTILRSAHKQAMWAALEAAELPTDSYELNQAICVALETPDAEKRWLLGEDVFAGVARQSPANAAEAEHNKKIIDALVAGALGKEA